MWLWVSVTMALDRSTRWFKENTCSVKAEDSVLQSSVVFSKAVVQGSTRLANVGVGAFVTLDAVHFSLPVVCLNRSVGS